jgi:glycosyltransferase involved in cell wall biosynthesis
MSQTEDDTLNPASRAAAHLNTVLDTSVDLSDEVVIVNDKIAAIVAEKAEAHTKSIPVESADVSEVSAVKLADARTEASVLTAPGTQRSARLLILTKDVSILDEGSSAHRRMTDLRKRFLEIHIVILNQSAYSGELQMTRLFENVWTYPTNAKAAWRLIYDAYSVIQDQLVFSGGFRADIIIAEDPVESGLVGWYISKKHKRPYELHIYEDFYDPTFTAQQKFTFLYEWCVSFVLEHVTHVRTKTEFQRTAVIHERPELESTTECIPQYYNLAAWKEFQPVINLHEQYPQFKFILLTISAMHTSSHTAEVVAAVAPILKQYPTLGLVIVGNGPLRADIEHQVIALGIQEQVEFEPMPIEVLSYLKTANVFLNLSEESTDDTLLLKAALSGIPIVANNTGLGTKLFVEGESACLCAGGDVACIRNGVSRYLNENQDRVRFARAAFETVLERVDQNYEAYLEAYAESIERCVVLGS